MLELFSNPVFVAAGGALISSPIIIHLINRLRFKRLRWAAMEFLLKAQKRSRRRLIIEQLLLLLMRCMLVILVTMLVARYVGFALGSFTQNDRLFVILIDDSLSNREKVVANKEAKQVFEVATLDVVANQVAKNIAKSDTNDRIVIIPLSEFHKSKYYQPGDFGDFTNELVMENLAKRQRAVGKEKVRLVFTSQEADVAGKIKANLEKLKADKQHYKYDKTVFQKVDAIFQKNPKLDRHLIVVSDARWKDFGETETKKEMYDAFKDFADKKIPVRLIDAVEPPRYDLAQARPQVLPNKGNLSVVDFRPSSRIVSPGMPVSLLITVANYGPQEKEAHVVVYRDSVGEEVTEVGNIRFDPGDTIKVPAGGTATTRLLYTEGLDPDIPPDSKFYEEKFSVRLSTPEKTDLTSDPLKEDNIRFTTLEIRDEIPVLLVDGNGNKGRERGGDSFHIQAALNAIPKSRYAIDHADKLVGGISGKDAVKVLERDDLQKYLCIFLLDVESLNEIQQKNLDRYLDNGGGVAIFLGPNVKSETYAKYFKAYKDEEDEAVADKAAKKAEAEMAFFPVPLAKKTRKIDKNEQDFSRYRFLVRNDLFGDKKRVPILDEVFDGDQKLLLKFLQVWEYYPVLPAEWKQARDDPNSDLLELATLLNDSDVFAYQQRVINADVDTREFFEKAENRKFEKYREPVYEHLRKILQTIDPSIAQQRGYKAFDISPPIQSMLNDQGSGDEDDLKLTDFWDTPDEGVRELRTMWETLRDDTLYGDPFIVAKEHKGGRVVTVLSSAGLKWNNWAGGSKASGTYPIFTWKMLYYLSSTSGALNRTVGSDVVFEFSQSDLDKQKKTELELTRFYTGLPARGQKAPTIDEKNGVRVPKTTEGDKVIFRSDGQVEPGYYLYKLKFTRDKKVADPIFRSYAFNVDSKMEGDLKRVPNETLRANLKLAKYKDFITVTGTVPSDETELQNKATDVSDIPWFFLMILLLLIAEQALAVHLSFNMNKGEELQMPAAADPRSAPRAA